VRIAAGDWVAMLDPAAGGAVASLTRRGIDVLRPTPAGARDPLSFGCFALVPYANRIADGVLAFDDMRHVLPRNYPGQAHPLHGVGWLSPWTIVAQDATSMTCRHDHVPDAAWPWRYTATQRFELDAHGLAIALTLDNDGDAAMPYSLGFHPYFARDGVDTLQFAADGVWRANAAMLPTELDRADTFGDWSRGAAPQRDALVDHCYTGWTGRATLARADGAVTLSATGTPLLHFYLPPGADFFCLEPVTAMPDGINRRAADVLAAGARRTIAMAIRG
jgi:aldose 1-epimerase